MRENECYNISSLCFLCLISKYNKYNKYIHRLSKDISFDNDLNHTRLQVYQLTQKVDNEQVFILQLKHTRNMIENTKN